MSEIVFNIECCEEGGFVAKAVGFPIFTEGETLQELKENIVEALQCHFDPQELPHTLRLHIIKEEVLVI